MSYIGISSLSKLSSEAGELISCKQQVRSRLARGFKNPNPKKQFLSDLSTFITARMKEGRGIQWNHTDGNGLNISIWSQLGAELACDAIWAFMIENFRDEVFRTMWVWFKIRNMFLFVSNTCMLLLRKLESWWWRWVEMGFGELVVDKEDVPHALTQQSNFWMPFLSV